MGGGRDHASASATYTPGSPLYAQLQAEKAVADQLDHGQITAAQAEAALAHVVDGTTAVAVADYALFTGFTPTAQGLNYLVHSQANITDLNDAYYAGFSTENRYINFAVNLDTGGGAGAAAFQTSYGGLSLSDAVAKAYAAVFGAAADAAKVSAILGALVPDGLGAQETRAQISLSTAATGRTDRGPRRPPSASSWRRPCTTAPASTARPRSTTSPPWPTGRRRPSTRSWP